jgi:hypothetical protein
MSGKPYPHAMRWDLVSKTFAIAGAFGALLLIASIATRDTIAQPAPETKPGAPVAGKKPALPSPPAAPAAAEPAAPPSLPVGIEQALYLIRSTLLTLNDANHSGNYTVLRDLAAPDFQARNTAADLAQIFVDLRRRNFDLYCAALLAPQLSAAPALDADKRLRLTGFFPTRPLQINFDLSFQVAGGQWLLFGIAITTPDAPPPAARAPAAAARADAPAPKKPGVWRGNSWHDLRGLHRRSVRDASSALMAGGTGTTRGGWLDTPVGPGASAGACRRNTEISTFSAETFMMKS